MSVTERSNWPQHKNLPKNYIYLALSVNPLVFLATLVLLVVALHFTLVSESLQGRVSD